MAVLAMTIGVIGIGAVLCAYVILVRELDANYMRTNPASATIMTPPVTDDLVRGVQGLPGIGAVEARGLYQARIRLNPDEWKTLFLFVIDDFKAMQIGKSKPEEGDWPPRTGDILIERAAFRVLGARIGDGVTVQLPGIGEQRLRISGSIHDPALAPAWMEGLVYGYVTRETLSMFGNVPLNEILLTVADRPFDKVTYPLHGEVGHRLDGEQWLCRPANRSPGARSPSPSDAVEGPPVSTAGFRRAVFCSEYCPCNYPHRGHHGSANPADWGHEGDRGRLRADG